MKVWDEEAEGGGYKNKHLLAANQEMYTISVKRRKGSDTLNSETCVHGCIGAARPVYGGQGRHQVRVNRRNRKKDCQPSKLRCQMERWRCQGFERAPFPRYN